MRELFKGIATALIAEILIILFKPLAMENFSQANTLYFLLTNIILFLAMFVWKYTIDKKENERAQKNLNETQRHMFDKLLELNSKLSSEVDKKADK